MKVQCRWVNYKGSHNFPEFKQLEALEGDDLLHHVQPLLKLHVTGDAYYGVIMDDTNTCSRARLSYQDLVDGIAHVILDSQQGREWNYEMLMSSILMYQQRYSIT